LITLDTLRADVLGCYGGKTATPGIDWIAQGGARFSRAYTVTPLTIPAHSSIFTGMLPPRHGVRDNGDFFLSEGATTMAELLGQQGYRTMAAVGAEVTSHHWGFAQGFDTFFDDMGTSQEQAGNRWRIERRGDAVLEDAMGWLQTEGEGDSPWFAWVHLFDVHAPYEAPEEFARRFPGRPYMAEVAWTDHLVERLIDMLRQRALLDDTWIFLVSDHGEGLGSHGEQMHGVLLYDATTRVPMILRPPGGVTPAVTVAEPTSLVDLLPTVLAAAEVPVPEGLDGLDLLPALRGQPDAIPPDRQIFVESLYANRHYGWAPQRALVEAEYKLIDSTTPELYQRGDRAELEDLAAQEPARLAEMQQQTRELLAALEPAEATSARAEASAERHAQLEALGYMTGVAEPTDPDGEELPDPVQRLPILKEVERARMSLQSGELDEALEAVQLVIQQEPGLVDPRMLLVNILRQRGERGQALVQAQELDRRQPSSQSKSLMGILQLQLGERELALDLLAQALELDPYLGRTWEPYLHALYMAGELDALEKAVARGREALPDEAGILGMEGVLLAMKGENEAAEAVLRPALEENPRLPFANHALGMVLRFQGDNKQAEPFLAEEVRLYDSMQARFLLVEIYAEQALYDQQLEQLLVIAEREPPSFMTQHSIAQALFNLQRYPEARTEVQACRQMAPEYPACAMLEANVLKKLGHEAEAQQTYEGALRLAERAKERKSP